MDTTELDLYEEIRRLWVQIDSAARVTCELLLDGEVDRAMTMAETFRTMRAHEAELDELVKELGDQREAERG